MVTTVTEKLIADTLAAEVYISSVIVMEASSIITADQQIARETIISEGAPGPQGPMGTHEDDIMYSKRVDFVGSSQIYRGEAAVGSSNSSSVWRIRRITIGVDGDVTEEWAGGTALFDKVWDNRAVLSYS